MQHKPGRLLRVMNIDCIANAELKSTYAKTLPHGASSLPLIYVNVNYFSSAITALIKIWFKFGNACSIFRLASIKICVDVTISRRDCEAMLVQGGTPYSMLMTPPLNMLFETYNMTVLRMKFFVDTRNSYFCGNKSDCIVANNYSSITSS